MNPTDRILSYAATSPKATSPKRRRSWAVIAMLALVAAALLFAIAALVIHRLRAGGLAAGGGVSARFAAQVPTLRAAYLQAEGHANRGPKFEELALALNHKLLSGQPPTEAEMVQTLGPPDLMQRDAAGRGSFAYFYDRFAENDWVVYFDYQSGSLMIGWNDASANPTVHASMRPYAPPPATRPSTSASEYMPEQMKADILRATQKMTLGESIQEEFPRLSHPEPPRSELLQWVVTIPASEALKSLMPQSRVARFLRKSLSLMHL